MIQFPKRALQRSHVAHSHDEHGSNSHALSDVSCRGWDHAHTQLVPEIEINHVKIMISWPKMIKMNSTWSRKGASCDKKI